MAKVKVTKEGPIHTEGKWAPAGNKCVCRKGRCVSWEAHVTFTIECDLYKELAKAKEAYAKQYAQDNPGKGATAAGGRLSARGKLFLVQEITKQTILKAGKECENYTENVIDIWQLPDKGTKTEKEDKPSSFAYWYDKCSSHKNACYLETVWNATVYVAFILSKGENPTTPDVGKDSEGAGQKGTAATSRSGKELPPKAAPPEDEEETDDFGIGAGKRAKRKAPPKPKTGFIDFKSAHYMIKVPDSTETYSMHPVVPHCRGSSLAEAKKLAKEEAEQIINENPEYKNNGVPADSAYFSASPEQPTAPGSDNRDNRLIHPVAPHALPTMIGMWRSRQRILRSHVVGLRHADLTRFQEIGK